MRLIANLLPGRSFTSTLASLVLTIPLLINPAIVAPTGAMAAASYPDVVMADNPVSYWRLDDPSGSTAQDQKGRNPGKIVGNVALGQPGPMAGSAAMTFSDGGNISLGPQSSLSPPNNWTVETWANVSASQIAECASNFASECYFWRVHAYGMELAISPTGAGYVRGGFWSTSTTSYGTNAKSSFSDGNWHYYVVSRETSRITMYVDGVPQGSTAVSEPTTYYQGNVAAIANDGSCQCTPLSGSLSEFAFYNYGLSADRVQAHWAARPAPAPQRADDYQSLVQADHPLGYWRMNDSTGKVATDKQGVRSGTLFGPTTFTDDGAVTGGGSVKLSDGGGVLVSNAASLGLQPAHWTIEMWEKIAAPPSAYGYLWRARAYGFDLYMAATGRVASSVNASTDNSKQSTVSGGPDIGDGVWHYAVTSFENQKLSLFVDGQLVSETAVSEGESTYYCCDNQDQREDIIGADTDSGSQTFRGQLAEVALYDHALGADRVQAHWAARQAPAPQSTGEIAYTSPGGISADNGSYTFQTEFNFRSTPLSDGSYGMLQLSSLQANWPSPNITGVVQCVLFVGGGVAYAGGALASAPPGEGRFLARVTAGGPGQGKWASNANDDLSCPSSSNLGDAGSDTTIQSGEVVVTGALRTHPGVEIQGQPIDGLRNDPLFSLVATFTDANRDAAQPDYSATIDWGDGQRTPGIVFDDQGGVDDPRIGHHLVPDTGQGGPTVFGIAGDHTYDNAATYPVTVTLTSRRWPPGELVATTTTANISSDLCTIQHANSLIAPFRNAIDNSNGSQLTDMVGQIHDCFDSEAFDAALFGQLDPQSVLNAARLIAANSKDTLSDFDLGFANGTRSPEWPPDFTGQQLFGAMEDKDAETEGVLDLLRYGTPRDDFLVTAAEELAIGLVLPAARCNEFGCDRDYQDYLLHSSDDQISIVLNALSRSRSASHSIFSTDTEGYNGFALLPLRFGDNSSAAYANVLLAATSGDEPGADEVVRQLIDVLGKLTVAANNHNGGYSSDTISEKVRFAIAQIAANHIEEFLKVQQPAETGEFDQYQATMIAAETRDGRSVTENGDAPTPGLDLLLKRANEYAGQSLAEAVNAHSEDLTDWAQRTGTLFGLVLMPDIRAPSCSAGALSGDLTKAQIGTDLLFALTAFVPGADEFEIAIDAVSVWKDLQDGGWDARASEKQGDLEIAATGQVRSAVVSSLYKLKQIQIPRAPADYNGGVTPTEHYLGDIASALAYYEKSPIYTYYGDEAKAKTVNRYLTKIDDNMIHQWNSAQIGAGKCP